MVRPPTQHSPGVSGSPSKKSVQSVDPPSASPVDTSNPEHEHSPSASPSPTMDSAPHLRNYSAQHELDRKGEDCGEKGDAMEGSGVLGAAMTELGKSVVLSHTGQYLLQIFNHFLPIKWRGGWIRS